MTTHASQPRSNEQYTPSPAMSQRTQNTKTFIDIMQLLAQVGDCIQTNQKVQSTAVLQQAVALLSTLSVAILIPDTPSVVVPTTKASKVIYVNDDDEYDGSTSSFVSLNRSLSRNGSTHSSPPRASYTALPRVLTSSPPSHFTVRVPGTPIHPNRLQPPAELLTPPPSNQKQPTWTAPGADFRERVRKTSQNGSDRSSLPSPTGSPVNEFKHANALFGFQSSNVPQISDADFQKRATHHRVQGRGDPKLYEDTLQLTGATTIDGHIIHFKITDAYWNPESYNYSESLCRLDGTGITGYRYDNRNGSTYIRFDEPSGPRICFVRHAHPPFVINSNTAPPASHGYIPQATPAPMSIKMMKPTSRQGSFRGVNNGSPEGKFSVQEFWN